MSVNSFGSKATLDVQGTEYEIFRLDAVPGQAVAHAGQRAAVDADDVAAGFGQAHQFRHVAADPGDAGHFGEATPVKGDGEVIRHLRRAGTAGAGIDQGQMLA